MFPLSFNSLMEDIYQLIIKSNVEILCKFIVIIEKITHHFQFKMQFSHSTIVRSDHSKYKSTMTKISFTSQKVRP